jgi:hypothetical protein
MDETIDNDASEAANRLLVTVSCDIVVDPSTGEMCGAGWFGDCPAVRSLTLPPPPLGLCPIIKKCHSEVLGKEWLTRKHSSVAIFGLLIQGLLPTLFLMEVYLMSVSPPKCMLLHALGSVIMTLT